MDTATDAAIALHLSREAFASALASWVDGTGSDAAVDAALARVERCELAAERVMAYVPSAYATNYR